MEEQSGRDQAPCGAAGGDVGANAGKPVLSVIIPAFNEAGTIGRVVGSVFEVARSLRMPCEVIVVDDGSVDGTDAEAISAGARLLRHPYNIGNGAAIKSGIRNARGKMLVMMDGDGQHSAEDIPALIGLLDQYDMVVAARTQDIHEAAIHRNLANNIYNRFASYVCGRKIPDLTSGFRAIKAPIAKEILPLLPNTFSYPTTMTIALIRSGYSVAYHPIKTLGRSGPNKSKIKLFRDGTRFLLIIFKISTLFSPMKIFLPFSLATFTVGLIYGLYRIFVWRLGYGPTSSMLVGISVLMFLIGLVSEQIAQQRYENIIFFKQAAMSREPNHESESNGV
jgi:glycosyltransferase involved in cell wall biosynthesis